MQTVITIDRTKLLQRLRLTLAYNADRNPAVAGRYAEVAMTTSDEELASAYWMHALVWVASALKRFGCEVNSQEDGVTLLRLSENSLASLSATIDKVVASAVESKIASEWLAVVGDVDSQARYREKAQGYVEEAIDLCLRRVRPQKKYRQ
jgi:hypothetical protein